MKFRYNQIKTPFIILILIIINLQVSFLNNSYAQDFSFPGNQKKASMDFKFIKNLIIVPIYINNKGPFNFILDTGVGPLIITDPSLLDTLNLNGLRTTQIYGLGRGQAIDAFLTSDINVKIKSANANRAPTVILKKDIFDLSNYLGEKIYGLLGFQIFNSFVVKINYASNRLSFALPTSSFTKKGEKFPIVIENNRPYLFTNLQLEDYSIVKVKLIIDCGASHALSMDALNGNPFPLPKDTISANLGVGLSGIISGSIGRIPKLLLGSFHFKNVLSGFPEYDPLITEMTYNKQNGNLGADILKRFNVIFDYQNAAMYLKPNLNFKYPFEHDMSGIEVYIDPNNRRNVFIGRIEPNSPAEKAGFLEQDQIVSINLKLTENYTLEEIGRVFKADDGQTVLVEIVRKNKNMIKFLKLKRRI